MIALQISVYMFLEQAIIAFRGEAQRVRGGTPPEGGKQEHAQEDHRAGQKGPLRRRQMWVGLLKAEGSEKKETAGTDRRWQTGPEGARDSLTTNAGALLPC